MTPSDRDWLSALADQEGILAREAREHGRLEDAQGHADNAKRIREIIFDDRRFVARFFRVFRFYDEWRVKVGPIQFGLDTKHFDENTWVASDDYGYLYLDPSLRGLFRQLLLEWRNDRHIVG